MAGHVPISSDQNPKIALIWLPEGNRRTEMWQRTINKEKEHLEFRTWRDAEVGAKEHEHVTPEQRSSHWLPVSAHIDFKLLLLVFKVLNDLGPLYLSELLKPYIPDRNLRFSKKKNSKLYLNRILKHMDYKTHLFRQL